MEVRTSEGYVLAVEPTLQGVDFALCSEPGLSPEFSFALRFREILLCLQEMRTPAGFVAGGNVIRLDNESLTIQWSSLQKEQLSSTVSNRDTEQVIALLRQWLKGDYAGVVGAANLLKFHPRKVGRNETCPCSSGRKYKKCCGTPGGEERLRALLEPFRAVEDHMVRYLIAKMEEYPFSVLSGGVWCSLASFLSSADHEHLAFAALERALSLAPSDPDILGVKASLLGRVGKCEEALTILSELPNADGKFSCAIGKAMCRLGRHYEAIPHFERAIERDPSFSLPYGELIECLERLEHPLVDYWISRAVRAIPKSPSLAVAYCLQLLHQNRLEELATAEWIESLEPESHYGRVIGRSGEDQARIIHAQTLRFLALAIHSGDSGPIETATKLVASGFGLHLCGCAYTVACIAARFGRRDLVATATRHLCAKCIQEKYKPERIHELLSLAAFVAKDNYQALADAESGLSHAPQSPPLLNAKLCSLCELDRDQEALAVGLQLQAIAPDHPLLNNNLAVLYACLGRLGAAVEYYQKELSLNPTNPLALENLAFVRLLEGNISEARLLTDTWRSCASKLWHEQEVLCKCEKFGELVRFAEEHRNSPTFALDLRRLNVETSPRFGAHTMIPQLRTTQEELLRVLLSGAQDEKHDIAFQMQMEQRGDFSTVVQRLSEEVGNIGVLPHQALFSFIEAERQLDDTFRADYAPAVLAFSKCLEILLREHVFVPFKAHICATEEFQHLIAQAYQEEFAKAFALTKFVDRGSHLELGSMSFCLALSSGRTAQRMGLLLAFREFIVQKLHKDQLTHPSFAERVGTIAREFRNPAAHAHCFSQKQCRQARVAVLEALRIILND